MFLPENIKKYFAILLLTSFPIHAQIFGKDSTYSNLNRISHLKSIQKTQLSNPIKDSQDKGIVSYNHCILAEQKKRRKLQIFGPFYLLSIEDIKISLQCSPCVPKGYPLSWSKLTFENFQTEVMKTDGFNTTTDLIIEYSKTDMSTYYCSWISENKQEIIMNIWTVEIVSAKDLEKIFARKWKHPRDYKTDEMIIGHSWTSQWSDCTKCGTAGKRHRFGNCIVHKNPSSASKPSQWKALEVYESLSCTLFLNLHPEIGGVDQELTQQLASSPKIMIGYCKVSCEDVDFNPEEKFLKTYPESVRHLYKNDSTSSEIEIKKSARENIRTLNFFDLIHGFKDIPITTDYIPEILAILSLIGLQIFILFQVYRNKTKAR